MRDRHATWCLWEDFSNQDTLTRARNFIVNLDRKTNYISTAISSHVSKRVLLIHMISHRSISQRGLQEAGKYMVTLPS